MKEMLDYIISLIFGAVAFVLLLGYQLGMREATTGQVFSSAVQQDLTSATKTLEYDFQKMGYGSTDSAKVVQADTSTIEFKCDVDGDGVVNSVLYYLGDPVPGSPNSAARILYRQIDVQSPLAIAGGVSRFKLTYFDGAGHPTSVLSQIRSVYVALTVESNEGTENIFPAVCWESTIRPRNLR